MKRTREDGYCELSTIRGQAWYLPRDQYIPVRAAWLKGAAFVDAVDFHGAPITIKLAEVDSISDVTAAVLRDRLEEKRLNEAEDDLAGGLTG